MSPTSIGAGIIPVAIEFMDKPAIEICEAFAHAGYPMDVEALLIVEVEGSDAEMDAMLARIIEIARRHGVKTIKGKPVRHGSCADLERPEIRLLAPPAASPTTSAWTAPCRSGNCPMCSRKPARFVAGYGLRVANVFHAGDGNMHPLILFDANDPEESLKAEMAGNDILKLCVDAGGCLTGEHGVGIEKRDLMRHQYSEADLAQQMRVRAAFDPKWILNPSKVFPLEGRNGSQQGNQSGLAAAGKTAA